MPHFRVDIFALTFMQSCIASILLRLTSMQRNVGEYAANDALWQPLHSRPRENVFAGDLHGLDIRRAAANATESVTVF